jgi:hypothetical protein
LRKTIEIKWFKNCQSVEQAKKLWKILAMQYHPDRGGDLRSMQEINAEWDYVRANPWVLSTTHEQSQQSPPWESTWTDSTWSYTPPKQHQRQKVHWRDIDPTPVPGRYTVEIIDVIDNEEKSYVALVFDIATDRYKGYFKHEVWYKHCVYLKYAEEWQQRNTVKIVNLISASNQGFDGIECLSNDVRKFIGKRFGVKLSREYIDGNGFINYGEVFAL